MNPGVLENLRVLDLSSGHAASVAALLLAEAGADVSKIEPRGGTPGRETAAFACWNRSKRSIAFDLASDGDRTRLDLLLQEADILIHDLTPHAAQAAGLGDAELARRFPQLICVSVTGYPAGHPKAELRPHDALVLAETGILDEQQGVSRDGPIWVRFPLGSWGAAYLAVTGVLARLIGERRGAPVGPVRTSLLQGALAPMSMHWCQAERPSESLRIGRPKQLAASVVECADSRWIHVMSCPDNTPLMKEALAAMSDQERSEANTEPAPNLSFPNWGANRRAFRKHSSDVWLTHFWAHDVAADRVARLGEVYQDEQANANGYVVEVDDPQWGRSRQPGPPVTVTPPARVRRPAPRLDEHAGEGWAMPPFSRPPIAAADAPRHPLAGIKVLDFGMYLAGPFAPMLLADLGAEVIKVEPTRGDALRPYEWSFTACQRGKRSIALDLRDPAARPVLERLVRWADIVQHNLRMPAAEKLGISYDALRANNSRLVYSHVSSYGPVGPRKDWPGFDQMFQSSCGWELEGAGEGNPPIWHRFGMMDHQCAMASLYATLLGLYRRDTTGEGQFVAASLLGASLMTVGETLLREDGTLAPYPRLDREQMGVAAEQRLYRCADGWIALIADALGAFERLMQATDSRDVGTLEARLAQFAVADALALASRCGIDAVEAKRQQRDAFFGSPDNERIGLIARYPHPQYGWLAQPGAYWDFGNLALRIERAPPTLGQHTREILAEFGFSINEADALCGAGTAYAPPSVAPAESMTAGSANFLT